MNRLLRKAVVALLLVGSAAAIAGEAARTATANRIVIQVNEGDTKKWNAILGNIHNIQADLGKQGVEIAVVAIGDGLGMLTEDSLTANRVMDAINDKVRFVACGNSMKAKPMARDELIHGVDVVPAGYVEIMKLQQRGWVYIRP